MPIIKKIDVPRTMGYIFCSSDKINMMKNVLNFKVTIYLFYNKTIRSKVLLQKYTVYFIVFSKIVSKFFFFFLQTYLILLCLPKKTFFFPKDSKHVCTQSFKIIG